MLNQQMPDFFLPYLGDPDTRIEKWIFTSNPKWPMVAITMYFVMIHLGKKFMANRKPFSLKYALILHNYFQILLSIYVCKEMMICLVKSGHSLLCYPYGKNDPISNRMAEAFWYFYASKYYDLVDTMFLVFKKKSEQLSFLHMYHHSSMLFNWYLGIQYLPGGQSYFSVLLNSFVHVVMYGYYFLAALGPWTHKYLWWKKYLTQLQLMQFILVILHICHGYVTGCEQPKWLSWFSVTYLFTLITLFAHFYRRSYREKYHKNSRSNGVPHVPRKKIISLNNHVPKIKRN